MFLLRLSSFRTKFDRLIKAHIGVLNISDDILIYGQTQEQHDENLSALLSRLRENYLTLNKDKCVFGQKKIPYYGYVFSDSEISHHPKKVKQLRISNDI